MKVCQLIERSAFTVCAYQKRYKEGGYSKLTSNPDLSKCFTYDCGWYISKEKLEDINRVCPSTI